MRCAVRGQRRQAGSGRSFQLRGRRGTGKLSTLSQESAFQWYLEAAENGDAKAQVNVGNRYLRGEGTIRDDVEALHWYERAIANGENFAKGNLGYFYENGLAGLSVDKKKALSLYQEGARAKNAWAQKQAERLVLSH